MKIEIKCKGRDSQYKEVLSEPTKAFVYVDVVDERIIHLTVICTHHIGGKCKVAGLLKNIFCPYDGFIPEIIDELQRKVRGIKEIVGQKET